MEARKYTTGKIVGIDASTNMVGSGTTTRERYINSSSGAGKFLLARYGRTGLAGGLTQGS
jgi:hypothetical protein